MLGLFNIDFAIVAQLVTAVSAIGAILMSWHNSEKIQEVHISINSRMDQLLASTELSARAIGAKEERDRGQTQGS